MVELTLVTGGGKVTTFTGGGASNDGLPYDPILSELRGMNTNEMETSRSVR